METDKIITADEKKTFSMQNNWENYFIILISQTPVFILSLYLMSILQQIKDTSGSLVWALLITFMGNFYPYIFTLILTPYFVFSFGRTRKGKSIKYYIFIAQIIFVIILAITELLYFFIASLIISD